MIDVWMIADICLGVIVGIRLYNWHLNRKESKESAENDKMRSEYRRILKELWYGSGWEE